ncbi:glycosyltransferase [Asanoa sp. WMMD1127]|uniref:glycosyltransferase family 2 protein n=1 Tax=Asanoa sp. WMMD1127 TaxID=3016107 RepID=UPI002417857E|nr:glycosyltransferase [Asanoa sp. WMMD1127]MDG4820657.1 glycosyltransferase [Asanoa sp. WMMD1127]
MIATRDRRDQLLRTLPRHDAPTIVVDNASQDGTAATVEAAFPHVRVVRADTNLGAAARNLGAQLADTPFVAFADDDSYWVPGALDRAAQLLSDHPRAGLLVAQVLVGEDGRPDPMTAELDGSPLGWADDLPGPTVLGFLSCAAVVRRDAFLSVGGFDPRLGIYGEEALLAMDLATAGWGLSYVPSLRVAHLPSPAGRDPRARERRQARNHLLTTWLRRPLPTVMATSARAMTSTAGRAGLRDALAELPWVLRDRRVVPDWLGADLRRLEHASAR